MTDTALINDPREAPVYTITEASRDLSISPHTMRSWVLGRSYTSRGKGGFSKPLIKLADPRKRLLSFMNLVEVHVISSTRQLHGVRMQKIRTALGYLQARSSSEHPLLTNDFWTDGKNLFIKTLEETVSVSERGQLGFKSILDGYLERIDRDPSGSPIRLFPLRIGQQANKIVVIDPLVSSGRPTVAGSGILVSVLRSRHLGGESIDQLADDYDLRPFEIEQAIRYFEAA